MLIDRLLVRRSMMKKSSCRANGHGCKLHLNLSNNNNNNNDKEIKQLISDSRSTVMVCDVEGALLRSSSTFPYFMLVALEAGGFLRGLLLLLLYPLMACLGRELGLRFMVMVAFAAVKADGFRAGGSAVLPKFFLEDVGLEGFEVLRRRAAAAGRRSVCVISCLPREMVEGFLKEYLEIDLVFARKLQVCNGYFTGFMEEADFSKEALQIMQDSLLLEGHGDLIVSGGYSNSRLPSFSHCKEIYLASEAEKRRWQQLPRWKYPKPLIFHDGRIAFRPIPAAALSMFMWLPLGFLLAIARALIFCLLPYSLSIPLLALLGMHSRLIISSSSGDHSDIDAPSGQLYVSNHRTLLDPLYISAAIGRKVTATTYSVNRLNEMLSPIRTIRLTRNREEDKRRMKKLAEEGDVAVHPEGTTCREPYLLRFSPLFAEICREVVPVALESRVTMFYGTSTSPRFKFLDPLYFLMNPWPCYEVEIMQKVISTAEDHGRAHEQSAAGGSRDTANRVQREIGKALGFECTRLTRRDKYQMLAGNEGIVEAGSLEDDRSIARSSDPSSSPFLGLW